VTGYLSRQYAESLDGFGTPCQLAASKGWLLKRPIPGFDYHDAMGCYPIFVCEDWSVLETDLKRIESEREIVCLSVVTDPFGDYDEALLGRCFQDRIIPFKQHYVVDLTRDPDTFVASHHRRNARRALSAVQVEDCATPKDFLEDWANLYSTLVERHGITGIAAFSKESFARQLSVPGIVAFRALYNDRTAGMLLWYTQGDRAYYHLGAYSPEGYESRASFALFSRSIDYFAERDFRWLNLGAAAGTRDPADSGLARFKQGWSTGTQTAYFCGRIFDRRLYHEIVNAVATTGTDYFPAYRLGEFG